ncbi:ABC transporter ATP-binding protein (plasmid) [Paroceanicella profunda]|uniref:ABC transporter ATP-binding protein n=1 Tax=Paroceanicella profunda TaxID=2579971 RepID=A0A5B8G468_9RHOB|nr:ABC transporter ATP-binding protein [Paroceanicella profunda]QDL94239.1 ABC transporter ATP-binding protein [Paroceanicella profunda]
MTPLSTAALVAGYERDLPIIKGIDFTLAPGGFVAVLGPNGAGKSTFVKAIAGLVPVHSGALALRGANVTGLPPHALLRRGLAFVPQTENIFATMTIRENLQLAAAVLPRPARAGRIGAMLEMFPDLGHRPGALAGGLSGGQRQMLAIARALLVEPQVLILDEPSAGLSPKAVSEVFETLVRINAAGTPILLVEQNVRAALKVAARAVILVDGRLRHDAPAAELAADPEIGALFLGAGHGGRARA